MVYSGIDYCDACGQPLDDGQWLSGLCESCERGVEVAKRVLDT